MRHTKLFIQFAVLVIVLASCSEQRFAYRKKVKADKPVMVKASTQAATKPTVTKTKETSGSNQQTEILVQTDVQQVTVSVHAIPSATSMAQIQNPDPISVPKEKQALQPQVNKNKSLLKVIKQKPAGIKVGSLGVKIMIIGGIILAVGLILGFSTGQAGAFLTVIGGTIFLIGLIFFIVELI